MGILVCACHIQLHVQYWNHPAHSHIILLCAASCKITPRSHFFCLSPTSPGPCAATFSYFRLSEDWPLNTSIYLHYCDLLEILFPLLQFVMAFRPKAVVVLGLSSFASLLLGIIVLCYLLSSIWHSWFYILSSFLLSRLSLVPAIPCSRKQRFSNAFLT